MSFIALTKSTGLTMYTVRPVFTVIVLKTEFCLPNVHAVYTKTQNI
jgi:hypothetical protein